MHKDQWSTYWQNGVATSFGSQLPPWYGRTLVPFWQHIFSPLPVNAGILDLASGNGAVARIAAQLSAEQSKDFKIIAVDKAALSPRVKEDPLLSGVEFVPDMPLEKLQLKPCSFHLLVSQFGIEYSSLDKSLTAISNVMNPDTELVMVAHHAESIICRHSRDELQQYRAILTQHPLFEKLSLLLKAMGEIRSKADLAELSARPQTEKQRIAFNRVIEKLMRKYTEGVVVADLLQRINPLFRENVAQPLAGKLTYVKAIKEALILAQQRLTDLLNAALNGKDIHKLQAQADVCGLELVSAEELTDETEGLLAWVIRLRRRGSGAQIAGQVD